MKTPWRTGHFCTAMLTAATVVLSGCSDESSPIAETHTTYDSPIINEDIPKMDISKLPDIDITRAQMLDLIEQVRAEVAHLVPASVPWEWRREEMSGSCDNDGRQGVTLYFANLTSPHSFTDQEWTVALQAVERLAADAGLNNSSPLQNSTGAHDVRITSDDGRELRFGSLEASLITGTIACRLPAGGGAP